MYTRSYAACAERLRASCERLRLPYALYETPTVHSSISRKGSPELQFTKANFIHFLLDRHAVPILYVDADCVFRRHPRLIERLLARGTGFAVYNWAADRRNDGFTPIQVQSGNAAVQQRFFGFWNRVNRWTESQLLCSGAVQLYANTAAARRLLLEWQRTVERFPGSADDACLDFTFNNGGARIEGLQPAWLPKAYMRGAWWVHVEPVIDHPDARAADAAQQFIPIPQTGSQKHFYPEHCELIPARFSENAVIDIQTGTLYEATGGRLRAVGPAPYRRFWPPQGAIVTGSK